MKNIIRSLCLLALTAFSFQATSEEVAALKVGVDPNYPPLVFKDDNGTLSGLEVDIAAAIANELNQKVEFVEMPFLELIPAVQSGKIDVIMSGMSVTDKRREQVTFMPGYLTIGQIAVIRKDRAAELGMERSINVKGTRIGVVKGTTGHIYAETQKNAKIIPYNRAEAGLHALIGGQVEYFIHDAPTSWHLAGKAEFSMVQPIYNDLTEEQLAWAVKKGNNELYEKLGKAYHAMRTSNLGKELSKKWLPETYQLE